MKTVTTIHLNGRAYQVEEDAHRALAAYLEQAGAALADNPDKDEILADFENAIAEKFSKYLTSSKNVITHKEVETIIAEMGPVDGTRQTHEHTENKEEGTADGEKAKTETRPKRLYRIKEGAVIAGVCNGLAAYFDVDVVVVRIIFVVVTLVSHGVGILAYLVMMFVVPKGDTSAARAHAQASPFNAHEFIEQAKKNYAEYKGDKEGFKKRWKDESKYWKYNVRHQAHQEMREARRRQYKENVWAETLTGILWFCIIIGLSIAAYNHVPFFHYNFDRLGHWITVKMNGIGK